MLSVSTKITYSENYIIHRYLRLLRYYEYYLNNRHWYNFCNIAIILSCIEGM